MRVKKKSDGMFATDVYRFMEYTSGLGPDGSRTAQIRNEQTLNLFTFQMPIFILYICIC
jgi:hypothetical protein